MRPIVVLALALTACAPVPVNADKPFVHVKRSALWVPDLDQAILFYRDVIGFEIYSEAELNLDKDSVLFGLFNIDPKAKIRRVLFSSSTEPQALFVMESAGAPEYAVDDRRFSVQVIRTDDLEAVEMRAKNHGLGMNTFPERLE